ncbi:hypothetical protein TcasGA2_TC031988 [Tribolium castaneum]|uniref:Odorant receptor n=1 Tax=Tribolium castaneum TaxID=7070 RepID=A0A139WN42_TRICA|nr:hypothetical protein TcasGA2_TC031988 [Tribolium castaneum]
MAIIGIVKPEETNSFFTLECLQTCILLSHTIGKQVNYYMNSNKIVKFLQMTTEFWEFETFQGTIHPESNFLFHTVRKMIRYYFLVTTFGFIFFLINPPVCYVPEGWELFLRIVRALTFWSYYTSTMATDAFFVACGTLLLIQFKLLGHKFKNLDTQSQEKWNNLRQNVKHQIFLHRSCKLLNQIFAVVFLIQFLNSIAALAISIFIFSKPGSWNNRFKTLFYLVVVLFENAFYCVPAELVSAEALKICDQLFASKWYESNVAQFRKSLVIVLCCTQKVIKFSSFGLVEMNLQTFVLISKTALSFYAFLNQLKR